jgi:dUTP pyrophosphatase
LTLKVKKLSATATIPSRGSPKSAGLDLYLDQDLLVLHPGKRVLASTGLAFAIPEDCYGRVAPRSGISFKDGVDVLAGVIDSDYREELKVLLINTDYRTHTYIRGTRIAQLILERIRIEDPEEVDSLDETERTGGFGSTGQ